MDITTLLDNIELIYKRKDLIQRIIKDDNIIDKRVQISETILPVIPILWYREQQAYSFLWLETEHKFGNITINKTSKNIAQAIYDYNFETDPYIITQWHVYNGKNIYISIHSLMYYTLHKDQFKNTDLVQIPYEEDKSINFDVKLIPLKNSDIIEVDNGLKKNEFVSGQVYIHVGSYSPPGVLHFKVNEKIPEHQFICIIKNDDLKINMTCVYILKTQFLE